MWSSRLFWKLFFVFVGLNLTFAAGFALLLTSAQRSEIDHQVEQRLSDSASMLRSLASPILDELSEEDESLRRATLSQLRKLVRKLADETDMHLAITASDGSVLIDTEVETDGPLNYSTYAEFTDAANTDRGTSIRTSVSSKQRMRYFAIPARTSRGRLAYVRTAVSMKTVEQQVTAAARYFWTYVILIGAVAAVLTYTIVGRIVHPIAQLTDRVQAVAGGKEHEPVHVESADELRGLANAFNQMQANLDSRFRQLQENNEQMATVLGSMDEGIIAVDAEENIVLANDASKRLLSFTHDDEIGRPLLAAIRSRALLEVVRKCQHVGHVQSELISSGQQRRDLEVSATRLPGNPSPGVVVVLHDITELRRLENLRQDFVANVSHELKTPLAAIKAFAETLRMGAIDDEKNNLKFLGQIEEQSDRLNQLIMDMLQIARIESGAEAFDVTSVLLDKVVDACARQHLESANLKNIQLRIEPPEQMLAVRADDDAMLTILDNLVSNAIKYTPEGGTVTVRWQSQDRWVKIQVQDSGIGIPLKHQERIFERFYRVDKARSRELGGTGLGLAIVKHLSHAFGGLVELFSEPGEGSTFEVKLPLAVDKVSVPDLVADS